ncbi:methyltransferase domain-containing protein [Chitinophaga agrisoli]|uniref:Methyltransferase domain-containing protein n=1 Tax=Chitinophaga agrisoli TaxID=2607653 RepID=A0A5B2VNS1_9BACT|nr:methyltransferase domain-containing protein [Chitinophaga agrisoli]KAA2239952.1 methyltransferase domain-containing protein [Chitinophaga agrisoli]
MTIPSLPKHSDKWFDSDFKFHDLYPLYIRELAQKHWTPLAVAQKASDFLAAEPGVKILDIGSGPGKFCLSGAYYNPAADFYGIEQRNDLVFYATIAKEMLGFNNVTFIHANLINLDFREYDHFYFFNSFYENLPGTYKIDNKLNYSRYRYNSYNRYLCDQLEKKPAGTRLATYHCSEEEVPDGYHLVGTAVDHLLNFWIKA